MEYQRSPGFRFKFGGVNLRDVADALEPTKYPSAQNIRSVSDKSIRTRPGYVSLFGASTASITDLKAYATLGTDDLPRFLARDSSNQVWLDTGSLVATLSGSAGFGVCMLPFRPGASSQTWMYVASLGDYQKLSAPADGTDVVTVDKAGIAEPQEAVDAAPTAPAFTFFTDTATNWDAAGTAASPTDVTLTTDTVVAIFVDLVVDSRYSVQVGSSTTYLIGEQAVMGGGSFNIPIQDVLPPIAGGAGLTITAIRYDSGTTGHCTIVPSPLPIAGGASILQVAGLRHGALIRLSGSEVVMVLSSTIGSNGVAAFDCETTNTHTAGASIVGVPAIVVDGINIAVVGGPLTSPTIQTLLTTGVGSLAQTFSSSVIASSPFAKQLGSSGIMPRNEDYIHLLVGVDVPANVTTLEVLFNVANTIDFQSDVYSYVLQGTDLVTQSSTANLTELMFPISSLVRSGGDAIKSLINANAAMVRATVTDSITLSFGSLWVGGGGFPDVGDDGADYAYRIVPRGSTTGATGNSAPVMRYGVRPRRQPVKVTLPTLPASYDGQIDTWDVYRYGGSVLSYRYIGSGSSTAFIDNQFDTAAEAGKLLETDNYEPWPSIDVPLKIQSGGGNTITVTGTWVVVSGPSSWPATIDSWLPGTLITLEGLQSYTLRARPTQLSTASYLFEIEESAGSASPPTFAVNEPNVARQILPYIWGPNEQGDVFAVGDTLRPGTVYFSKSFNPDSAPDNFNLELCPPSEPLIGGEVMRGVSYVASTKRWWALFPAFNTSQRYTPLEQAVGRPLISPYGHCTDGQNVYFWTKDGIGFTAGSGYKSLTDADLYPLFPHEGVSGADVVRNDITYYAPDYTRAASFRLAYVNGYLYADYQDSDGTPRTLVCDLKTEAWSQDSYADAMTVHYGPEQQSSALSSVASLYPVVLMGDSAGNVYKQADLSNDDGESISASLSTFEWDGGDMRARSQFGDAYLDCVAPTGIVVVPQSLGFILNSGTQASSTASRQFTPISLNGGKLANFVGLKMSWVDDFDVQLVPTTVNLWQVSFLVKPETTRDRSSDWDNAGSANAKYFRGFVLRADTFGAKVPLVIRSGDDNSTRTIVVQFNGEGESEFNFDEPFISHLVRIEPQALRGWRFIGIAWIKDEWPELARLKSPWLDAGTPRAKYIRGFTVPLNTNGESVVLKLLADGGTSFYFPPTTTGESIKRAVSYKLVKPIVAHEVQFQPLSPARVWWDEIQWDFEPWPELLTETGRWMNLGSNKNKYIRSILIPLDTNGETVQVEIESSEGQRQVFTARTDKAVKTPTPLYFRTPFIAHSIQVSVPGINPVRIWFDEITADAEEWPELIAENTPWMNEGSQARLVRGGVIPIDTGNHPISLTIVSSDGDRQTVGPFTTPFGIKTPVEFAMNPLVAHARQVIPSGACRIWDKEIRWVEDEYPELASIDTPWLMQDSGAKYLREVTIPIDTHGVPITLDFVSSDDGFVSRFGPFVTQNGKKVSISFAFNPPIIVHARRIVPSGPCRIWWSEIKWGEEPYPELTTALTPWTDCGYQGSKYMRGVVIPVDTNDDEVAITFTSENHVTRTAALPRVATVPKSVGISFRTPFIVNNLQASVDRPARIFWEGARWNFEPWPELFNESSPWMDLGAPGGGAKYLRGCVIPMDTDDSQVSLRLDSSDGESYDLGLFKTPSGIKSSVAFPFRVPLIGHQFQLVSTSVSKCRIWFNEIRWDFEPWPEVFTESSPWLDCGQKGAKYIRGVVIPIDTGSAPATLTFVAPDGTCERFTVSTPNKVKTPQPIAFSVPFIVELIQVRTTYPCRIWWDELKWEMDPWPELVATTSPWMSLGTPGGGVKYMRGCVIPMDTGGETVGLTLRSSDGGSVALRPIFTTAKIKTPVAFAFTVPLLGHEFQLIPSVACRIWFDEIRWDYDPWPELISEATGWLKIFPGNEAAYLQGFIIPMEANAATPTLSLRTDRGETVALTSPVTPAANVKTAVPFSLSTPVVAHEVQLVPSGACRLWMDEIKWFAEQTPELAATWKTQYTDMGIPGYKHIGRMEACYAALSTATLLINTIDGVSPASITLPATGGVKSKILITPTVNKFQLAQWSIISAQPFQVFVSEFTVWLGAWGRSEPYTAFRGLGGAFDDKAAI